MKLAFSALGDSQKIAAGLGTDSLVIDEKDLVKIKNTLTSGTSAKIDTKKKEVACLLMAQELFETAVFLPGAGDDFGKERVLNGLTSETLHGTKIIKTIKNDIIPVGHIWAFTSPDFLGHNFALGDPSFEIQSKFGLIEWQTKESIGMGIGNTLSTALLTTKGSKGFVAADGSTDSAGGDVDVLRNHYNGLYM